MKTQRTRTRRRKLRFHPTADAVPVVTVTLHQPPVKRRRRRRSPKAPASRPQSGLPAATWRRIEDLFAAAKSLGEITRTVLQFLKEHEDLQRTSSEPAFPIFVPASEIYKLKVPRKRRIYDVLHVLEGLGVIKRVRWNETRKTKGGSFLYYGKAAAIQRLAEIKRESAQVIMDFRQIHGSKPNTVEEESALVKVFEDRAALERWPCLVTTTTCFLSLLFQQDYEVAIALHDISGRLIEAKKFIGALVPPSTWTESTYNDVQRRVYDVASVLVSCNLILTSATRDISLGTSFESVDKTQQQRKHVVFNYVIFTDSRMLFASDSSAINMKDDGIAQESIISPHLLCSPAVPRAFGEHYNCNSLSRWQHPRLNSDIFTTSPTLAPAVINLKVDNHQGDNGPAKGCTIDEDTRSQPQSESAPRIQELFSPFGRELVAKDAWCDESLGSLELYDALPSEDKIDWELNKQFKESYQGLWGSQYSPITAGSDMSPHQVQVDQVEVTASDLECHEVLSGGNTNFFC